MPERNKSGFHPLETVSNLIEVAGSFKNTNPTTGQVFLGYSDVMSFLPFLITTNFIFHFRHKWWRGLRRRTHRYFYHTEYDATNDRKPEEEAVKDAPLQATRKSTQPPAKASGKPVRSAKTVSAAMQPTDCYEQMTSIERWKLRLGRKTFQQLK